MTWQIATVLLGAMFATAFLVGYLAHLVVYYRLEYEPEPERVNHLNGGIRFEQSPREPSQVDTPGWAEEDEDK